MPPPGRRWPDACWTGTWPDIAERLDSYRYEVEGKLLTPVPWSALQDVDLGAVPTDGRQHDLSLYMQDTGWPDAPLDDYIELWDKDYWQFMRQIPEEKKLLDIVACFQVAHGSGIRPEAILMQKIMNFSTLGNLLTSVEKHDPATWPGSYMAKGLELRDQWESKLLVPAGGRRCSEPPVFALAGGSSPTAGPLGGAAGFSASQHGHASGRSRRTRTCPPAQGGHVREQRR